MKQLASHPDFLGKYDDRLLMYVAVRTMPGVVDLSFSSSVSLEIFELDFQSEDGETPVIGESISSERFNWLSWGNP
ncbi:hypothetical protein Vadar_001248 [Vaccinium darrowii]|uniref:Uncharacterized protein n=1 Tax=Vaccinium darrowii TaxID=229202 RepID=A0ACB7ZHM7_9ERIC|nr:hypothetical protein Vadar_001248 [Vaccinium darrowii]